MNPKEDLANKKFLEISEKIRRKETQDAAKLTEKFSRNGMLTTGKHARARVDLELETVQRLLLSKLKIDETVFSKTTRLYTEKDEKFLKERIENLYNGCIRGAIQSIKDFHARHGLPHLNGQLDYFHREGNRIVTDVKRKIEIMILENQISFPGLPDMDLKSLIKEGESNQVEFKSTFQWDVKKQCKNKDLRMEVISTIAAFNNTKGGGHLLIGVDDNGNIYGLEKDYSLLSKKNKDGFLLLLTQEIENRISREFITKIGIEIKNIEGMDVCKIKVNFGDDYVLVKDEKGNDIFFIRTQNSTRKLALRESIEYIRKTWPHKK